METNLKFKVGDKVRVKSLEWYNSNKNVSGEIIAKEGKKFGVFNKNMRHWCGDVIKINSVKNGYYGANNCWRWYDWMLESKAVAEEKQEVEQLNKNNMETKKMTLKEAQEFVKNTKYIVWSEDVSRQLQEKLFKIGCRWIHSGKAICHTEKPFLIVDKSLNIRYNERYNYDDFEKNENHYIETYHILNIELEIEQPKPKFDPNTLQPFDKVLVRDETNHEWLARFFHHIGEDGYYHTMNFVAYRHCIPFNNETKHLFRTNKSEPEFYRV